MFTKEKLIEYEGALAKLFEQGLIKVPIHLSGGNEDELIEIFKGIDKDDYVFSTHRNHYHYLLHTGDWYGLMCEIMQFNSACVCNGKSGSMHTINHKRHFYSSGIVAGCVAIAAGVALALKMKGSKQKVWCFIGDGAADNGWFYEAARYAVTRGLPIQYIIENNDRSVCSSMKDRWETCDWWWDYYINGKAASYNYTPTYPHVGVGKWVTF